MYFKCIGTCTAAGILNIEAGEIYKFANNAFVLFFP
jgi:hypothetical protein